MKEEVHDPHVVVQKEKNMDPGSSDDETQDANVDRSPGEQRMPVPIGGKRGFKYVEPVRKKAERQNLKGVQCKQCKKFYDAVLPNNGGKSADGNQQNVRCEHHDGVSRHRYKYAPPLTPEGFWNIGFESEM
jgi:splicing factor 4